MNTKATRKVCTSNVNIEDKILVTIADIFNRNEFQKAGLVLCNFVGL